MTNRGQCRGGTSGDERAEIGYGGNTAEGVLGCNWEWGCYDFIATCFVLTFIFFLRVRSRTLCAQWTCHVLWTRLLVYSCFSYHVPPARVLVRSHSVLCVSFYMYLYRYRLSTRLRLSSCSPFPLLCCRLICAYCYCLRFSFCSLLTRLSSRYSWTLTRY